MKNKILISAAIILTIAACKKNAPSEIEMNVVQKNFPSFESLMTFFTNQKSSGKFLIETNSGLGGGDSNLETQGIHLNGAFINKSTQERELGQTNSFGDIDLTPNADGGYDKTISWQEGKHLFGKNLSLKLRRGATNVVADTVIDFNGGYIPEIFLCSNYFQPNVSDQNMHYYSGDKMKPAFTFTWNKDTLNKNGVFIYIEYEPTTYGNESLSVANPTKASNAILVPDNGTYTLTSDMFTDIPLNARISVQMGRGNFGFIKNSDGTVTDMQMVALTYQTGTFYYKTD